MSSSSNKTSLCATRTEKLAQWAVDLQYQDIPQPVVERTKELFLDWLGCAIAGRHHPAVSAIARYTIEMGPTAGKKSEFVDGSIGFLTSPALAALVNGASSHVVEQDDLHNRSMMHPVSDKQMNVEFTLLAVPISSPMMIQTLDIFHTLNSA
jgi:aconitate decarboxylase